MINEKIKVLRSTLDLSINQFSVPLERSASYFKMVERNITTPDDKLVREICEVYHVNPEYFYGEMKVEDAVEVKSKEEKKREIGRRVKEIRTEKGMTLVKLSELSGIAQSQLSNIENNGFTLTKRRACILGEILGVGAEWLLTGDEENKDFPVNGKMVEWLKAHPEERERIWKKIEAEETDK